MTTIANRVPVRDISRNQPRLPALLVVPAVLLVVIFFGAPLVVVLIRSFTDPELGLQNYIWMLTSEAALTISARTFVMATLVSVICVLLAFPYAYVMASSSERTRRWLLLVIMFPLYSSILIRTLAWVILLQDTGPINDVLELVGIGRVPLIRTDFGVALGMVQVLLPFAVLPIYSVMRGIDPGLTPAARSLGAKPAIAFLTVFLPLSRPGIVSGATTIFILALGFFIIPSMLGAPHNALLPSLIYQQIGSFLMWGRGSALGAGLLIVTLLLLAVGTRLGAGRRRDLGGK